MCIYRMTTAQQLVVQGGAKRLGRRTTVAFKTHRIACRERWPGSGHRRQDTGKGQDHAHGKAFIRRLCRTGLSCPARWSNLFKETYCRTFQS